MGSQILPGSAASSKGYVVALSKCLGPGGAIQSLGYNQHQRLFARYALLLGNSVKGRIHCLLFVAIETSTAESRSLRDCGSFA